MNSHFFLQYGLRDLMVSSFPYAFWWIHQLPEYAGVLFLILLDAPLPQFFIILQGIARATDVSNFLRVFLMVSLKFLVLRGNEIDPSAIFVRYPDGTFHSTTFASPSAWQTLLIL